MTTEAPEREHVEPATPGGGPIDGAAVGSGRPRVGTGRDAAGREVPTAWARARARVRLEDPLVGWAASIGVALLAFVMRVWRLGSPHKFLFDETYYAKDAWSLIHFAFVHGYVQDADAHILDGQTTGQWTEGPSMIVHPEVGKWLIGSGEAVFGMTPFGWRIASVVIGSLMVLVICRLARRLSGSTLIGLVAGLLMTFDGMQFVLSRLALLDIFLGFFILLAVTCLVCDRDWYRARLARLTAGEPVTSGWGPVRHTLFRPWLLASGVAWGLACGTKWTAIYPLAAFGVMSWLWSSGARRAFGVRWALLRGVVTDGIPAFLSLVVLAGIVYTLTWTGWLIHASEYESDLSSTQYTQYTGQGHCDGTTWVADNPDPDARWPTATEPDASGLLGLRETVQSLRSLGYYHRDVYTFHTHFLNCATHPYASKPLAWPLLNRDVGVDADTDIQPGNQGCQAQEGSTCLRVITLLGTPVLWWGACAAALVCLVLWIGARDWRFGVPVVGMVSTWLPWIAYDDRPIFSFYAIATLPFMVLAVALVMGKLVGRSAVPTRRRTAGVVLSGIFLVAVIANFAWLWPVLTDKLLTHDEWTWRIWFSHWV